jgi:enamine deaminase RidA (YjgF/YER057c/UK114 family)
VTERETIVPTGWESTHERYRLSPMLRVGNRLYLSGHTDHTDEAEGGDVETKIRSAFADVARTLALAGASWRDVVSITSYHVGLNEHKDTIIRVHNEFVSEPYPTWTGVGVAELSGNAIVEVAVVAELSGE